jgi:hypothetical protein
MKKKLKITIPTYMVLMKSIQKAKALYIARYI